MTEQEIVRMGPAFAAHLGRYRECFLQKRTAAHFDNYCRGLLTDLPRKSVEPIALASGTAVRTLQEFLTSLQWDHEQARTLHQQNVAAALDQLPRDRLGRVGVIDETSAVKKGDKTPGVQRQYCGAVGKIENCIVTVHVALVQGRFKALLDADLYLPQSWAADRPRCRDAGIPDTVGYRSKWRIALAQLARLEGNDLRFDWLVFDEGYGSKVPFLRSLNAAQQRFVAEVPRSFAVRSRRGGPTRRADERLPATQTANWQRFRLPQQTRADPVWRAQAVRVWAAGRRHRLMVAINEATGEVKYFVTNVVKGSLARVLRVAFLRWHVEHVFRVAKQETGLTHYEGRVYQGLVRHLILGLIVLGFVSQHTERLRGEKSPGDAGAGLSSPERALRVAAASPPRDVRDTLYIRGHPLPSVA